ncbi:MAG TPA: Uma2 family endonuclease [Polyangiaceae bacterium]|nr:Uma2 family endonuclease [Polyangiaceae bacterium]
MSEPARRRAGWDDLLDVREGFVGEIVGGQLQVHPRPGPPHAETASDLGAVLTPAFKFGRGGPGGWVILDEPRVDLSGDIRVPDLAGWRSERYERPARGPYTVVPDWICEVLSPATATVDRTEKLPLYQRCGVSFLWLVDPLGFTLEAYRLEEQGYLLLVTASGRDVVRAPPFDAIELELALLWGDRFDGAASRRDEED